MSKMYRIEDIAWKEHPTAKDVAIKPLISKKDDGALVSCLLVRIEVGKEVPMHTHDEADDIILPLEGKAVMFVEGIGEFTLEKGMTVRVVKGKKHRIFNVTKKLTLYDVFSPATI